MSDNIVDIGAKGDNNRLVSPSQVCKMMIEDIENGELAPNKAMILHLTEDKESYHHGFYMANMNYADAVALLSAVRFHLEAVLNGLEVDYE